MSEDCVRDAHKCSAKRKHKRLQLADAVEKGAARFLEFDLRKINISDRRANHLRTPVKGEKSP